MSGLIRTRRKSLSFRPSWASLLLDAGPAGSISVEFCCAHTAAGLRLDCGTLADVPVNAPRGRLRITSARHDSLATGTYKKRNQRDFFGLADASPDREIEMHKMGLLRRDVAIDLGGSTVRIFVRGEGLVISEPNLVAVREGGRRDGEIVAVGSAASQMLGRTPANIRIVRPVEGGVIRDFEGMEALLRCLAPKRRFLDSFRRARVVVGVPLDCSPVESRAVYETIVRTGGRDVQLVPKTIAAAIGLDLSIDRPSGHFILDIGGGTTEIGVISSSGIVTQSSSRTGGAGLNDAIRSYVKRKCNLLIGDQTAERLKIQMGTAYPIDDMYSAEICGRDLISGVPKTIQVNSEELREALEEPVSAIVESVRETLERTPPELASDLYDRGIMMVGGGSLLPNLDFRLREATGLPVILAEDPTNAVVLGVGAILEDSRRFPNLRQ